jgi:hypothetical protein
VPKLTCLDTRICNIPKLTDLGDTSPYKYTKGISGEDNVGVCITNGQLEVLNTVLVKFLSLNHITSCNN